MKARVSEDYISIIKLGVIAYAIYCSIYNQSYRIQGNIQGLVLVILIYICLNIIFYMINQKAIKILLSIISLVLVGFSVINIETSLGLLIPLSIYDLIFINNEKYIKFSFVAGIFLIIIPTSYSGIYILFSICSFIIYYLIENYMKKINSILIENDNLREVNSKLNNQLEKRSSYEKQIIYTSQLEERNKIAQQMHDKLGHTLAGSLLQLEAIRFIIEKILKKNKIGHVNLKDKQDEKESKNETVDSKNYKDLLQAKNMLVNTIEVLRVGMDDIRMTLRKIRPPEETLGINRIRLILEEGVNGTSFNSNLIFKGDLNIISYEQWKVIGECLRESITNSIKYSKGNNISVNIVILNKIIKSEIRDNGIGFNNLKKGMGLSGIEQRVMDIGGKTIIDGHNGFSLSILLPINKAPEKN